MAQAPHPRMHGLTHLTGGADPIPGLLPGGAGTYTERVIAEPALLAYWPLSDPGVPCADVSGNDKPLTVATGTPTFLQPGPLPDSSYPYAVALNGTFGLSGAAESLQRYDDPADLASNYFEFGPTDPFTFEMWVYAAGWPTAGFPTIAMLTLGHDENAISLNSFAGIYPQAGEVACKGVQTTGVTLNQNTWVHVAATFDGTVARIYFDAAAIAAGTGDSSNSGTNRVEVGGLFFADSGTQASWNGSVAHVAVYNQALTQGQLAAHLDGVDIPAGGVGAPGEVLSVGDDGQPEWEPPGVTVEHGGGSPDPAPLAGPGGSGATSTSGWHLTAHTETAVLYDSSPARFDVPTLRWVRTPFDTVRIQRSWETTVGGPTRSAWLPDDRGLTEQARNGLLHINPDMVSHAVKHIINGFFSIEYPVLDYQGLPDYTGGGITAPDDYVRAARVLNASTGVVLRRLPGSTQRRFMQWEWFNDADGMAVSVLYTVDNPYPLYPVWPARPLTLPQPYPKLSPTDSLTYYLTNFGNPGFNDGTFNLEQNLVAGDNLCLQAWQDSPWLLRFSTDHFPNWRPWPDVEVWRRRPFLSVSYQYDPETINHTTGKML